MSSIRLLIINIDFFNTYTNDSIHSHKSISSGEWTEDGIRVFLQDQCGLDPFEDSKPHGRYFFSHIELYHFCRVLKKNRQKVKFDIDVV